MVLVLLGIVGGAVIFSGSKEEVSTDSSVASGGVMEVGVMSLSDLSREVVVKKTSQLTSSSTITISSQAGGRVKSLWVKAGDVVTKGRQMVSLADTVHGYSLALERA